MAKLHALAEFCNFGASLEAMLWDQIVRGINDSAIQGCLLAEAPCHLRKPYSWLREWRQLLAMSRSYRGYTCHPQRGEKSDTSAKGKPAKVMAQFQGSQTARFRCGSPGHVASRCRFKDGPCHHCEKTGHLQAVCYGKAKGSAKKSGTTQSVQHVQEQAETEEYSLFHL